MHTIRMHTYCIHALFPTTGNYALHGHVCRVVFSSPGICCHYYIHRLLNVPQYWHGTDIPTVEPVLYIPIVEESFVIQHVDSACTKRTTLCETCYMWSGPLNQGIQHAHKHDMLSCYPLPKGDLTNHCLYAACTHHMVFSTCGYYVTNRHVYMFNFISYTPFPWNYITHTL